MDTLIYEIPTKEDLYYMKLAEEEYANEETVSHSEVKKKEA